MTPQEAKDKIEEILGAVSHRAERYYLEDTWIRWGKIQRDINDVIDRLSRAGADAAPVVVPARRELALAGMGIMISIGKWGGIYFARGWSWRICLGWVAISVFPCDGDTIIDMAAHPDRYGKTGASQTLGNYMVEPSGIARPPVDGELRCASDPCQCETSEGQHESVTNL